jgi:excisionase family DNA binding protein
MEKLLTTAQCAEILRYHPRAVNKAILDGNLRATKLGRDWLIKLDDLRTFIELHPRPNRLTHINLDKLKLNPLASQNAEKIAQVEKSAKGLAPLQRTADKIQRLLPPERTLAMLQRAKDAADKVAQAYGQEVGQ